MNNQYELQYAKYQGAINQALEASIPQPQQDWPPSGPPAKLAQAMRYSLLSGGKRLRPVLLLAAYHALHEDFLPAMPFACATEMVHCYSLIHDDMPAMDDDDLRRGQPTNHKVYGEAMAILAGDALLTLAFETMLSSQLPHGQAAALVLSKRAGQAGMIAGQTADILLSGQAFSPEQVRYIHQRKTGDLICSSLLAGAILGGAEQGFLHQTEAYGRNLGLAFQITDDLLDLAGQAELTGKASQRDFAMGKQTWPQVFGLDKAKHDAEVAVQQAIKASSVFGKQAWFFETLASGIVHRVR